MRFKVTILLFSIMLISLPVLASLPGFAKDPAISPDGNQVCFVFDDDLWIVPFKGGIAHRITNTPAREWGPKWSPDGTMIAFNSDRDGGSYPYIISAEGGQAKLIIAGSYSIHDWYNDSEHLLVTKSNFEYGSSFFKLSLSGERPIEIGKIANAFATLSPDNKSIVFCRYGDPYREAYTGSLNGDLWSLDIASGEYTKLTTTPYTERYPAFSHLTNSLFYCYSDGERFQLYRVQDMDFERPFKMSELDTFSARDISVARANDRIVFEHFNEIYKYDPTQIGKARVQKLDIQIREDLWQNPIKELSMRDDLDDFFISDDEQLVAFNYKYDNFLVPAKGGEAKPITSDHSGWANIRFIDDKTMLIVKKDGGLDRLYQAEVSPELELKPVKWFGADSLNVEAIRKDSQGRLELIYQNHENSYKVALADKGSTKFKPFETQGLLVSSIALNMSGSHAAYWSMDPFQYTRALYIYDFAKKQHHKVLSSQRYGSGIHWSPDNRSLYATLSGALYRLDLVPRDELADEKDHWYDIFNPKKEKKDKDKDEDDDKEVKEEKDPPVEIVWENIDKRFFQLYSMSSGNVSYLRALSDTTFLFLEHPWYAQGKTVLKKGSAKGSDASEEASFNDGSKSFKLVGKTLYYLDNGKLKSYNTETSARKEISISLDYSYNVKELNSRVFEQVWGNFKNNFYDANMHGIDWNAAYELYHPYLMNTRSINEVGTIIDEMVGDLNASHTGFYPRPEDERIRYKSVAYLGVELDYSSLLKEGIRISRVYPGTQLDAVYGVREGDILTHINDTLIDPMTTIDQLLADKVDKTIKLKITQGKKLIEAKITGLSYREQYNIYNADKLERREKKVHDATGGKVGYIHVPAMGTENYDDFYRDYFVHNSDKDAVILDFRGNRGGRIHDRIISLLSKPQYAYSLSRRHTKQMLPEPKFAINVPTVVLVDEHSFSDGEIFPIVYRELGIGKVIGYPSSGAVIGTQQYNLLDGSEMRMPVTGWYTMDGTNMEGSGAMPDIIIEHSLNDIVDDHDKQLDRAIEEILKELP